MDKKIVAITGASSGMGFEAAKLFAKNGWQVFAGARRVEKIPSVENITAISLDVTDSESNRNFIKQILENSGRIDVLINNAGYGEFGPAEEVPMAAVRRQFETNFFGVVELTQLVLPAMRAQHSGRIVNVSSIVGDIYFPLCAYYDATKAALNQWSNVLDLEVAPFGVRSIVIQPGDTGSAFQQIIMEKATENTSKDSAYFPLFRVVKKEQHRPFAGTATPADLAKLFYKASIDQRVAFRYYHLWRDHALVHLARSHPRSYKKLVNFFVNRHLKQLR